MPLTLEPQRWSPAGKEWVSFQDVSFVPDGATLSWTTGVCTVVARQGNTLQLSTRLSRREASELVYRKASLQPEEWAPHFLTKWNQFWQRGQAVPVETPAEVLSVLPVTQPMASGPLTLEDWKRAIGAAKTHTMRGVDGWSTTELRHLPDQWVLPLLELFARILQLGSWPRQLSVWLLILLRKSDKTVADWSLLRPISVASLTHRIWSRMYTMRMLTHGPCHCVTFCGSAFERPRHMGLVVSADSYTLSFRRRPGRLRFGHSQMFQCPPPRHLV